MIDHFHHRLNRIERTIERSSGAPTFPIYDVGDFPQDAINGQIAIGTDNSINWFVSDSWKTHAGVLSTVVNAPQDPVEGQLAIGIDYSLNWYVNGNWYGAPGVILSGNPPQDAVIGQLAIGTNTLAWFINDLWYGFTGINKVLRIKSSSSPGGFTHDNFTPALYYMFPATQTDVWVRANFRHDIASSFTQFAYLVLGFTEWVTDQAYYGDWWRTGGFAGYTENNANRTAFDQWNAGHQLAFSNTNFGVGPSHPTAAVIYDYHATYNGDTVITGQTASMWTTEAYKNGVLRRIETFSIGHDTGKPLFHSFKALSIFNHYGDSFGWTYIEDISVGTAQGASDIMPIQTFDDGSFGAFTVDPGDVGFPVESFEVVDDPLA